MDTYVLGETVHTLPKTRFTGDVGLLDGKKCVGSGLPRSRSGPVSPLIPTVPFLCESETCVSVYLYGSVYEFLGVLWTETFLEED